MVTFPLWAALTLGYLWWNVRHSEKYVQRQIFLGIIPLLLGFSLSGFLEPRFLWIGVGGIVTALIYTWFWVWRFPKGYRTALQLFRAQAYDEALQAINLVIAEKNDLWEAYHLRSNIHLLQKHYGHALQDGERIKTLAPELSLGHLVVGNAYLEQNKITDAHAAFQQAYALVSGSYMNRFNLGVTHYRLDGYEAAIALFEQISKQRNVAPFMRFLSFYYLGRCQMALGNESGAKNSFRKMAQRRQALPVVQEVYKSNAVMKPVLADIEALVSEYQ